MVSNILKLVRRNYHEIRVIKAILLIAISSIVVGCGTYGAIPRRDVSILHFNAELQRGSVLLNWQTSAEGGSGGFNILRSVGNSTKSHRINPEIIPPKGMNGEGGSYVFTDTKVKPGETYNYILEDISLRQGSTSHGPMSVTVREVK